MQGSIGIELALVKIFWYNGSPSVCICIFQTHRLSIFFLLGALVRKVLYEVGKQSSGIFPCRVRQISNEFALPSKFMREEELARVSEF